jgi:trans-aconitate 2-methyltransferase
MPDQAGFTTRTDTAEDLVKIWRSFRTALGPARVLDLGCGTGGVAIEVARCDEGSTAVGLDSAHTNIDQAVRNASAAGLSRRVSFVCSPYEAWQGGKFDAILSDSVLHIIGIEDDILARRLADNLAPGGLLVAAMPQSSIGNSFLIGLRCLWRISPAGMDGLMLLLAKLHYRHLSTQMLRERVPYMRVVPARLYGAPFIAALYTAGLERIAERPWPSPSIAKLKHCVLVWRRQS